MPEVTNIGALSKGVTDLARDAAYVAVGFGVLGFQRVQVQRVQVQNHLSKGTLDEHLDGVRGELTKGVKQGVRQIDDLLENATQFVETNLQPLLEAQLPAKVTVFTSKAVDQSRGVRSQIRQQVISD
jgi:hypothetical protein